jgi:hypothetical protein
MDSDRDFFLAWREIELDPYSFGMMQVTNRRDGKSARGLSILINALTSIQGANLGILAQNAKMASSLFQRAVRMWQMLPEHEFFFPMHSGDNNPKSSIELSPPKKRSTKTRVHTRQEALYSWLDHRGTTEHAYDGEGLYRLLIDEGSKMESVDINELYNVHRETLADGSTAIGKMLVTSTAENIGGKTLKQFEELWKNSDPNKRNDLGQTASGIVRYFKPATKGYRHDPEDGKLPEHLKKPTVDEWGYSDEEAARQVILALRKNKKGNRLIEFIRKYPLDVTEAFTYGVSDSPFDTLKINQQKAHNHDIKRYTDPIVRGNFEWAGGQRHGAVEFYPRADGKYLTQGLLRPEENNQFTVHVDGKMPTRFNCVMGIDSFDHTTDNLSEQSTPSKGAGAVLCYGGGYYDRPTFIATYVHRPPTPEIFYEDMLKMAIFYSCPAMIENQKPTIMTKWKEWGYKGYILKDPFNPKKLGVSTRSDTTRLEMDNRLMSFIYENVGKLDDEGSMGNCYFDDMLEEWLKFNPEKRTRFDLTIASELALLGTIKPPQQGQVWTIDDWFHTHK